MINKPQNGWCEFKLEEPNHVFVGKPSYLTDVPIELLDSFIDYYKKGSGICWFDEEGSEFSLILTPNNIFILEEKEKPILHEFFHIDIRELSKELIRDIEEYLDK